MLKFIIDTQLPSSLSKYLSSKSGDSRHTTDYPSGHLLKDKEIVQIAIEESRIVVTKDQDLFEANWLKLADMLDKEVKLVLFSIDRIAEYKL